MGVPIEDHNTTTEQFQYFCTEPDLVIKEHFKDLNNIQ